MQSMFPRTEVGGISLSRMIIGSNWILGYSHTGQAADAMIQRRYDTYEKIVPLLEAYMAYGIDTVMAPFGGSEILCKAIKETEQRTGRQIIMIDTPIINVDDSIAARAEAKQTIQACADRGSKFCLIHHSSAEQLVNKNTREIKRIGDYTEMIRACGLIPGLSAHMPELVVYADENEYDIETYIQIYNAMGFMMQVEIETVASIIHHAKKPVITIKPMAAGRCTPFVGLNFSWNTIRAQDMVAVGAFTPEEALEDIEISIAALERRLPDLEGRNSPNNTQAAFGK